MGFKPPKLLVTPRKQENKTDANDTKPASDDTKPAADDFPLKDDEHGAMLEREKINELQNIIDGVNKDLEDERSAEKVKEFRKK